MGHWLLCAHQCACVRVCACVFAIDVVALRCRFKPRTRTRTGGSAWRTFEPCWTAANPVPSWPRGSRAPSRCWPSTPPPLKNYFSLFACVYVCVCVYVCMCVNMCVCSFHTPVAHTWYVCAPTSRPHLAVVSPGKEGVHGAPIPLAFSHVARASLWNTVVLGICVRGSPLHAASKLPPDPDPHAAVHSWMSSVSWVGLASVVALCAVDWPCRLLPSPPMPAGPRALAVPAPQHHGASGRPRGPSGAQRWGHPV